jgi:hypothetical protein
MYHGAILQNPVRPSVDTGLREASRGHVYTVLNLRSLPWGVYTKPTGWPADPGQMYLRNLQLPTDSPYIIGAPLYHISDVFHCFGAQIPSMLLKFHHHPGYSCIFTLVLAHS